MQYLEFSFVFPRHDAESENTWTFVCKRLMKDNCFHEEQQIVFTSWISLDCSGRTQKHDKRGEGGEGGGKTRKIPELI